MALRDQPYLPLFVQDYLTDEKLNECRASTQGIYIKIMCIMHKSNEYGCILLEQKYKQTDNQIKNFALKLVKHLPFSEQEIFDALFELIQEKVIYLVDNKIYQKRMVKDNEISLKRSEAGHKGGKKTQFAKAKVEANNKAKAKANTEYEIVNENIYDFILPEFVEIFKTWMKYKSARKEKYKSIESEKAFYKELLKFSQGNLTIAEKIINKSMANNWAGIFELKESNNGTNKQSNDFDEKLKKLGKQQSLY